MHRFLPLVAPLAIGLAVAAQPPSRFQHTVSYGGRSYVADFELHSARGPNFSVQIQQSNGTFVTHTAGPVRTYIGAIAALPGAMASALRRADGSIYYHVLFEDGAEWIHNGGSTTLRTDANWRPRFPTYVTGSGGAGSDVFAAELGVDLPNSQYAVDGDADAALEMIEHSVNTVNLIYLRDTSILHRLGRVVLRARPGRDPYAGMTSTGALLGEIANQWNNVLPPSAHDVALVATSATGGGVAWVGVIGSPAYSANGSTREGDFTVVWRHEVGHNWSLGHYDGDTPEGATINSGNRLSRLSGPEQARAIAHREARVAFLDNLGPHPAAIPPRASLDRGSYLPQGAPLVIDVLDNDHDANGEALQIASFDTTSQLGGAVRLSPGSGFGGRDELVYTPPTTPSALADRFTYRIRDTAGREGLGNVITQLTSDADLLAHFSFDDGGGVVANDSSEYRRHAQLENGPVWAPGTRGGGLSFDGVDDRVIASSPNRSTARFTITGWVKRNGTQNPWAGLVFCRGGSTTTGLNFGTANELRYHWNGGKYGWNSGLVVPEGSWTFVALAVTPTAATIYMDAGAGLLSATNAGSHAAEAFDAVLTIGRDPNGGPRSFAGTIDDIRVHGRALSAAEITAVAAGLGSAADPTPASLSTHNASILTLAWTSSPAATDHRIYLSRSYAEVRDAHPWADQGPHAASSWTSPPLGNGDWYWRIDSTDGVRWVEGPVWSFSVVSGPTPPFVKPYGAGCPGSDARVPRIAAIDVPRIGTSTFAVELTDAAPNALTSLHLAESPRNIPIGSCRLLLGLPIVAAPAVMTDASGRVTTPLPVPLDVGLLGARLFGQYIVVDSGGALLGLGSMSDGLHVTVGL